jgi:catechol 2,3-dioxygenase-like lactoylglutathione lyase family enzyme
MNITQSQIFVLDQDQALDFYVGTLGLEIAVDSDLGFMRWLTVRAPGADHQILLEVPGPPAMDPATAQQVRELVSKGASAGWLCLSTDDAYAEHARLAGLGVDITDEPTAKPYGVDFGIRDPFGNAIRIGQPAGSR